MSAGAPRTRNEDERRHQPSHGQPSQAQQTSSSSVDLTPAGPFEPPVGGSPGMCCAVLCCAVLCCAVLWSTKIKHDQLCFPLLLRCSLVLLWPLVSMQQQHCKIGPSTVPFKHQTMNAVGSFTPVECRHACIHYWYSPVTLGAGCWIPSHST